MACRLRDRTERDTAPSTGSWQDACPATPEPLRILDGIDPSHLRFRAPASGVRVAAAGGTITAFTVAHSLALAGATPGWVQVPQAPVEGSIAEHRLRGGRGGPRPRRTARTGPGATVAGCLWQVPRIRARRGAPRGEPTESRAEASASHPHPVSPLMDVREIETAIWIPSLSESLWRHRPPGRRGGSGCRSGSAGRAAARLGRSGRRPWPGSGRVPLPQYGPTVRGPGPHEGRAAQEQHGSQTSGWISVQRFSGPREIARA